MKRGKWDKKGDDKRIRGRAGVDRANRVKAKAGYKCAACGILTTELEADHIIPLCKGGKDDERNMQALCGGPDGCHAKKTAQEALEGLRAKTGKAVQAIGADGWPIGE